MNSGRVAASHRLAVGDRIRVPPVRLAEREAGDAPAPALELPGALRGRPHPGRGQAGGAGGARRQRHRARRHRKAARRTRRDAKFLELVHRLDRETSGVLLLAKKRSALTAMHEDLRERAMDKRYLVAGGRARARRDAAREGGAAPVLDRRGRAARGRRRARGAGGRDHLPAPRPQRGVQPARGRAPHRAHAPDPRAPRAHRASRPGRREVRRLRAQQGAAQARTASACSCTRPQLSFDAPGHGRAADGALAAARRARGASAGRPSADGEPA